MPEAATATPTVQAPTPSPSSPAPSPASSPMSDAYADLDRMAGLGSPPEEAAPESSAKSAAKPSPEKPSTGKPPSAGKSEPKKEESPDTDALPAGQKKPESKSEGKPHISELRTAYEDLKAKHKQLQSEYEAWKKAPPEDPEKKVLSERFESARKRLEELESEIKFSRYEASSEYKEKYEKPFVDAYQSARTKIASLKVVDAEGAVRQATPEDFDRIVHISDDDMAAEAAQEMFGAKAPVVLYHRERVHELNAARVRAIEDFRTKGVEREKLSAESEAKLREQRGKLWQDENAKAVEKYPQWFKPEEGDEEGNKILEEGFSLADKAFSGRDPNMTDEDLVRLHSAVRNRAAGFGRLALQNRRLLQRVSELEKELEQFKKSEPTGGDGSPKPVAASEGTMESVLSGLDQLAT